MVNMAKWPRTRFGEVYSVYYERQESILDLIKCDISASTASESRSFPERTGSASCAILGVSSLCHFIFQFMSPSSFILVRIHGCIILDDVSFQITAGYYNFSTTNSRSMEFVVIVQSLTQTDFFVWKSHSSTKFFSYSAFWDRHLSTASNESEYSLFRYSEHGSGSDQSRRLGQGKSWRPPPLFSPSGTIPIPQH